MRQMIYTSTATSQLGQDDVFRIVEKSVSNNMGREITGFLIYADQRFFQLIEGEEGNLRDLLATLQRDPRHSDINILLDRSIAERRFPRWRMQRVGRSGDAAIEVKTALRTDPADHTALHHVDMFLTRHSEVVASQS